MLLGQGVVPRSKAALLRLLRVGAAGHGWHVVKRTLLVLAAASLAACGSQRTSAMAPAAPASASPAADGTLLPPSPRDEITRLDQEITAQLAQAGLATSQPPACAAAGTCSAAPMAITPIAQDPTCKPGPSETCTQSCTLSTSICDNAGRICALAKELGSADAYANEKCERGNESCKASRERCCGCT